MVQSFASPSPMAPLVTEVRNWCDQQMSGGHEVGGEELMDEFRTRLEDEVWHLSETQKIEALIVAEAKFLTAC